MRVMVDETDGRGDVTPRNLNELDDVDGVAAEGDLLRRAGGVWGAVGAEAAAMSPNGPRINFYTGPSSTFAHDTLSRIDTAPAFDNAQWLPYAGMDLVEFGEWYDRDGEDGWWWRPTEPGSYLILAGSELQLNTTMNINTRMGIKVRVSPQDYLISEARRNWAFTNFPGAYLIDTAECRLDAPQQALDAGNAFFTADVIWARGASETCVGFSWFFVMLQLTPGAETNIWGEL